MVKHRFIVQMYVLYCDYDSCLFGGFYRFKGKSQDDPKSVKGHLNTRLAVVACNI